jgi:hypothetical protein
MAGRATPVTMPALPITGPDTSVAVTIPPMAGLAAASPGQVHRNPGEYARVIFVRITYLQNLMEC